MSEPDRGRLPLWRVAAGLAVGLAVAAVAYWCAYSTMRNVPYHRELEWRAQSELEQLAEAVEKHRQEKKQLPADLADVDGVKKPFGRDDGSILDPWGHPLPLPRGRRHLYSPLLRPRRATGGRGRRHRPRPRPTARPALALAVHVRVPHPWGAVDVRSGRAMCRTRLPLCVPSPGTAILARSRDHCLRFSLHGSGHQHVAHAVWGTDRCPSATSATRSSSPACWRTSSTGWRFSGCGSQASSTSTSTT